MKLFHGSETSNIERLETRSIDKEGKPVLYLTDNWVYSLFYLRDRDVDFVTCGVSSDSKVHYDEKIPNQLKMLYQGRSGYIYQTDTTAEPTSIRGIWISRENTSVTCYKYIPDVYEAIVEEINKGTVEFLPYEKLTEDQRKLNHEGVLRYFLSGRPMNAKREAFYKEHFQDAWLEAQNILAQWK